MSSEAGSWAAVLPRTWPTHGFLSTCSISFPKPGDDDDPDDPKFRNKLARNAIQKMKKASPSPIYLERDLELITPGNVEDHLDVLADADWVVEAVPEKMSIKQSTFEKIEEHAGDDTIIASNTSGLSIEGMLEGRSDAFKERFLVTHFFNPVRYMKLLELVPAKATSQEVVNTWSNSAATCSARASSSARTRPTSWPTESAYTA